MKPSNLFLPTLVLLLAGCAGGGPSKPDPKTPGEPGEPPAPAPVANVTGRRIRAEWRNLDPRYGPQHLGLINRSSPELPKMYANPRAYRTVKPVDDEVMGNVLEAFRRYDFYEYAEKGKDARSYAMGDGHYVISVTLDDEKWALVFRRGAGAQPSPVPRICRDLKVLLMHVFNSTYWLQPSAPQSDRIFRVPRPKYPIRR